MNRLLPRLVSQAVYWLFTFLAVVLPAHAQFKIVGPAPYTPAVARQRIRSLLEKADPGNTQKTVDTLSGLLAWYRDIVNEELIAAWQKDGRANLPPVMEPLADLRVATAVVDFSWRQAREATFNLTYAAMLGDLMARYPASAKPFLDDLFVPASTGQPTPELSEPVAEAVCRILLDMPDIGTWKTTALKILPHYRRAAEILLAQDMNGTDREKGYQAQRWLAQLRPDPPAPTGAKQNTRRTLQPSSPPGRDPAPSVQTAREPLPAAAPPAAPRPYNGPKSGKLQCSGDPIPQNAEYVFNNVPLVNMQLDLDTRIWDARVAPGDGLTQRLILTNISSSPQKHCVVKWKVMEITIQ